MSNILKQFFKKVDFVALYLVAIIVNMAIFPSVFIEATKNGLLAFAVNLLPSLLPLMIFSRMLMQRQSMSAFCNKKLKIFGKLFGTSAECGYVFLMSIISGYPLGAKMLFDLYDSGKISQTEVARASAFCLTSGTMFCIASVGICMFGSAKIGIIIYVSHVLASLVNGLLFRKVQISNKKMPQQDKNKTLGFVEIVLQSVQAILSVGAIICVFFVVICVFDPVFSLLPNDLVPLLQGVIEITKGCLGCATLSPMCGAVFASAIIGFGGISGIFQCFAFLQKCNMPLWLLVLQKICHATLSAILCLTLCLAFV